MQTSNQGTTQKHAGLYKFRQVMDKVMNGVFFFCGAVSIAAVLLITVYLVIAGLPAIGEIGIVDFLFGTEWASTAAEPKFGILPFILTSVWGMLGASLLGVPVGLMCAVYLSKVASKRAAGIVRPAVELLSGIPSVVYGLVGMMVLVPAVMDVFNLKNGTCLLAAILVLAVMILPSIISVSETALLAVPPEYEEASLALGASKMETVFKVSIPAAKSGGHGRYDGGRQRGQHARAVQKRHLPHHGGGKRDELCRRAAAPGAVQHCACAVLLHHGHQRRAEYLPETGGEEWMNSGNARRAAVFTTA